MAVETRIQPLRVREAALYFLMGFAFLILETTVMRWIDPYGYAPDLCLILVVHLGLSVSTTLGAPLVALLGFMMDVASGGLAGLHPAAYLAVFWMAGFIRQALDPVEPWHLMLVMLALSAISTGLIFGVLKIFDRPIDGIPRTWTSAPAAAGISSITTALFAPPIMWLAERARVKVGGCQQEEEI